MLSILLLFVCISISAQETDEEDAPIPFNGIVTDLQGTPIKNALVYVIDKNFRTFTNKQGQFGLTNVHSNDTIHITYHKVMYKIPVDGRKSMRIRLGDQQSMEATEDQELVDLGYAFVKRREFTGTSSGISGAVLVRTGKTNILDAMQGLVAGLTISNGKAIIRGIGTINSSTDPLFIVDGITVSTLDFVNVYDVDHVEVLKDASIYGARGANGAIIVHTKRGGQ